MAKYFLSTLLMMFVAAASFGQTTKPKLDAVKTNPQTSENAAKADVQVASNKKVADMAALKAAVTAKKQQKARTKKKKRAGYSSSK